jgi:hypothetical protein
MLQIASRKPKARQMAQIVVRVASSLAAAFSPTVPLQMCGILTQRCAPDVRRFEPQRWCASAVVRRDGTPQMCAVLSQRCASNVRRSTQRRASDGRFEQAVRSMCGVSTRICARGCRFAREPAFESGHSSCAMAGAGTVLRKLVAVASVASREEPPLRVQERYRFVVSRFR